MSKFVILILIIVILVVGIFWWQKPRSDISGRGVIIKMTEEGFSPLEIKIKPGTTIRFLNKSKYWHWPASDLHPTHTLYPEFDPLKPIGPKEEWDFKFEKNGEWGFHDHLAPYITGKVIVVE